MNKTTMNKPTIMKLNPYWVTGFADAEANFYIRLSQKSNSTIGWTVEPVYSVRLHVKDLSILNLLQDYFNGVGKIYHDTEQNEVLYRVGSMKELETIISHFDNYSLITQKYIDFVLFKQVIELMKNREHLSLVGILKIANIKASMNTKKEVAGITGITPVPVPSLPSDAHLAINSYWIAGFTAGEGCFSVSINKSKAKLGVTSELRFILTQHNRDQNLIKSLQHTLGCGNINQDSKATYLVVRRLSDLTNIIIPFFGKYPIMGNKTKDFEDFKRVAHLMNSKSHLTKEGVEQIRQIKSGMNTLRK